jgi:hypothetical protein
MSDTSGQEALGELLKYRDTVRELLKKRRELVEDLERQIGAIQMQLREVSVQRLVRSGDAQRVLEGNRRRSILAETLQKLNKQMTEARGEQDRAEERLRDVDSELQELQGVTE